MIFENTPIAFLHLVSDTLTHPERDVSIRAAYQGATIA
jgi:hypothetical protein